MERFVRTQRFRDGGAFRLTTRADKRRDGSESGIGWLEHINSPSPPRSGGEGWGEGLWNREMPRYRFVVHGQGDFENGVTGFYATRSCLARNLENAAAKVLTMLRKECERRRLGTITSLEVEESWRVGACETRKSSDRGFTFYTDENE
jgi:hypothetical protein